MIPFSILSGQLLSAGEKIQEVSILDVSRIGFTFRLPRQWHGSWDTLELHVYCRRDSDYHVIVLHDVLCEMEQETEFFTLYRVECNQSDYKQVMADFMAEYSQYISLKLAEDDGQLAQTLTGYPAHQDTIFASHWDVQRRDWFSNRQPDAEWQTAMHDMPELAIALDRPELWEKYLAMSVADFLTWYWTSNGLNRHPIAKKQISCLYLGNAYCSKLFPTRQKLRLLIEKTKRERLQAVLVTAPLRECKVEAARCWLDRLPKQPMEIVCNDWGMLELVKQAGFVPVLGTLLNKRRKDARMHYKIGMASHQAQLQQTAVHTDFYRDWLKRTYHVETISFETCGYIPVLTQGADVYAPFYQMNTAGHCTLYAACHNGSRGRQTQETDCPQYCRECAFLYPDHLHMIGWYNSLFGADLRMFTDGAYLNGFLRQKPRRIIIQLL